jgi:hypothetical protein
MDTQDALRLRLLSPLVVCFVNFFRKPPSGLGQRFSLGLSAPRSPHRSAETLKGDLCGALVSLPRKLSLCVFSAAPDRFPCYSF